MVKASAADSPAKQIRTDTGICHFRVDRPESLSSFLLRVDFDPLDLEVDAAQIEEWLHFGSVYVEGRRVRANCELSPDQIVRVHTRRKNYVSILPDLTSRILHDHPDFLVLDKPSGLPTHATLDNFVENAAYLLQSQLGIPLFVTHRLDVATAGLLILAKSPKAQAAINKQFAKRQVQKFYLAQTDLPVPRGLHVHFMDPASRVPKVMSAEPQEGWWECRLEVLSSEAQHDIYVNRIQLLTGRTHQIRAQLSFRQTPIKGDTVYGSKTQANEDSQIALACEELKFRWLQEDLTFRRGKLQKRLGDISASGPTPPPCRKNN